MKPTEQLKQRAWYLFAERHPADQHRRLSALSLACPSSLMPQHSWLRQRGLHHIYGEKEGFWSQLSVPTPASDKSHQRPGNKDLLSEPNTAPTCQQSCFHLQHSTFVALWLPRSLPSLILSHCIIPAWALLRTNNLPSSQRSSSGGAEQMPLLLSFPWAQELPTSTALWEQQSKRWESQLHSHCEVLNWF